MVLLVKDLTRRKKKNRHQNNTTKSVNKLDEEETTIEMEMNPTMFQTEI